MSTTFSGSFYCYFDSVSALLILNPNLHYTIGSVLVPSLFLIFDFFRLILYLRSIIVLLQNYYQLIKIILNGMIVLYIIISFDPYHINS